VIPEAPGAANPDRRAPGAGAAAVLCGSGSVGRSRSRARRRACESFPRRSRRRGVIGGLDRSSRSISSDEMLSGRTGASRSCPGSIGTPIAGRLRRLPPCPFAGPHLPVMFCPTRGRSRMPSDGVPAPSSCGHRFSLDSVLARSVSVQSGDGRPAPPRPALRVAKQLSRQTQAGSEDCRPLKASKRPGQVSSARSRGHGSSSRGEDWRSEKHAHAAAQASELLCGPRIAGHRVGCPHGER
jgi:hypothetical protein